MLETRSSKLKVIKWATNNKWWVLLLFCSLFIAFASLTSRGKTLLLTLSKGSNIEWKNYKINLNYSYIGTNIGKELIVRKINPAYDGYDKKNTLSIGEDAQYAQKLIENACAVKNEICVFSNNENNENNENYESVSISLNNQYQIFHYKDNCEAFIYYKGIPNEHDKYKEFIDEFFSVNC